MVFWNHLRRFSLSVPESFVGVKRKIRKSTTRFRMSAAWIPVMILKLIGHLPRKPVLLLGTVAGLLYYASNRKRRVIARKNLEICFPHWPMEKRKHMMRQHFRHFAQAILDLGMIWSASEQRLERWVRIDGIEHCARAQRQGKPVILITPHVVSVDMSAVMISRHFAMCTMMKDLRNPIVNDHVIAGRSRFGLKIYKRKGGIGRMIRELKRKSVCYYIPDQDLGAKNSVFVPFFGVQAATLSTLDRMVDLTGAVVMPVHSHLDPVSGRYHVTISEPLSGFPTDDGRVNARLMNSVFEEVINAAPEQYMWTLRWFKTRPDNDPPLY